MGSPCRGHLERARAEGGEASDALRQEEPAGKRWNHVLL